MILKSLSVLRMPGFETAPLQLRGLTPGLNVVTGPNASGKTTLCHAFRALLWPTHLADVRPLSLSSQWDATGTTWTIDRELSAHIVLRDGLDSSLPTMPVAHLAHCFTITVDDLFLEEKAAGQLADRVFRQLHGGTNLRLIRSSLESGQQGGRNELRDLVAASRTLREVKLGQETLLDEEQELETLQQTLLEASLATQTLPLLNDARQLRLIESQRNEIQKQLMTFPGGMEHLGEKDEATLQGIEAEIASSGETLREAESTRGFDERRLTALGIPATAQLDFQTLEALAAELRDLDASMGSRQEELRLCTTRIQEAVRTLGPNFVPDAIESLDITLLGKIGSVASEILERRVKLAELKSRLLPQSDDTRQASQESIIQGISLLGQWLRTGSGNVPTYAVFFLWIVTVPAVFWLSQPDRFLLIFLASAVGGILVTALLRLRTNHSVAPYRSLGLPEPARWDLRSVAGLLQTLQDMQAAAVRRDRDRESNLQNSRMVSDAQAALEECLKEFESLTKALGLPIPDSVSAVTLAASNLNSLQQSHLRKMELQALISSLSDARARVFGDINKALAQLGSPAVTNPAETKARIEFLRNALVQADALASRIEATRTKIDLTSTHLSGVLKKRETFFLTIGHDPADAVGLKTKFRRRAEWLDLQEQVRSLNNETKRLERNLAGPGEAFLTWDIRQLETEIASREALLAESAPVAQRCGSIKRALDDARGKHTVEDALAKEAQARDQLFGKCEEILQNEAALFLLDGIESRYHEETLPAVVTNAQEWFRDFTRGTFELKFDPTTGTSGAGFFARRSDGTRVSLENLSRGTRMQLLLALKIAFGSVEEGGAEIPILLDEVLSHSDPGRAKAIIEAVLELVKHNRQVIYLTCQPSDTKAWTDLAAEAGVPINPLTLGCSPDVEPGDIQHPSTLARPATPKPASRNYSDYLALLNVPPLNPRLPAVKNHIGHFLDDVDDLHKMLTMDLHDFGQFCTLASTLDMVLSAGSLARAKARGTFVDAFAFSWSIGRGRFIDRAALEDCGVSAAFLDRLSRVAKFADGDARRFLAALGAPPNDVIRADVKGFGKPRIERLNVVMDEKGYWDPQEPYNREQLLKACLDSVRTSIQSGDIDTQNIAELFGTCCSMAGVP